MKTRANYDIKVVQIHQKNHTCRWYDDTQSYKIFCPNSTSFVRYKNNKFLTNHMDNFLAWNLFFLYLIDEVKFGQDILQGCVSSYHLHVFFFEFRRLFFAMVCTGFHEVMVCTRYVPISKSIVTSQLRCENMRMCETCECGWPLWIETKKTIKREKEVATFVNCMEKDQERKGAIHPFKMLSNEHFEYWRWSGGFCWTYQAIRWTNKAK